MNETIKAIIGRRSVREYKDKQVPKDKLEMILTAGTYAPSGMGQQASMLVAVQNPDTVARLSKINRQIMGVDFDPFYGAPTVVVVFADGNRMTYIEDGSLVMGNMMIAAASLGIDSCWVHRAKETFETEEGKELLKEWGIPEGYVGIGKCILGYHSGDMPEAAERRTDRIVYV